METARLLDRIAHDHQCTPELARALMSACLAALHETSYKHGTAAGVRTVHAELGSLATWHFAGLLVDAAEEANPGAIVRALLEADPAIAAHDAIAGQWDQELR